MITRESSVTALPGVGKARAASYEKMGIRTLGELLEHYPIAYENRGMSARLPRQGRTEKAPSC